MLVKKAVAKRGVKAEKLGRNSAPAGKVVATYRSIKKKSQRPHGVTLADLFLWITVVDECQTHPMGAFERAAVTEGLKSYGNIQQRLKVLETRFGVLFQSLYKKGALRNSDKKNRWLQENVSSSPSDESDAQCGSKHAGNGTGRDFRYDRASLLLRSIPERIERFRERFKSERCSLPSGTI
jgi:hypothetical protein